MRRDKFLMVMTALFFSVAVKAQTTNSVDVFEIKNRIEQGISAEIRQALETRLAPDDFTVSVHLRVLREDQKVEPQQVEESLDPEVILPGLAGRVTPNAIINMYERELQKSGKFLQRHRSELDELKNYRVVGTTVSVGLTREVDTQYRSQLQAWLNSRLRQQYGRASFAEVNQVPQKEKTPEKVYEPTTAEKVAQLQWLLVTAILATFIFAGVLTYHWFKAKLKAAELKHRAMLKQMDLSVDKELDEARKSASQREAEAQAAQRAHLENEKRRFEIQKRVVATLKNIPSQSSALVSLLGYEKGGLKLASLVDATYAIEGRETVAFSIPDVFFHLKVTDEQKKDLQESFQEYKALEPQEQIKIMEDCLWSLATIGVSSDYQDQKMFQYLRNVSSSTLPQILKHFDQREQAVALLHLPQNYRHNYFRTATEQDKAGLLQTLFTEQAVTYSDLNRMNTNLMDSFKNYESGLSLVDGAYEILKSFSAIDEVKVLRLLEQTNRRVSDSIRASYLTLAYTPWWTDEAIKILVDGVDISELVGLVNLVPGVRTKVVSNVSEMMARVIEDDLSSGVRMTTAQIEVALDGLRQHLWRLEEKGLLDVRVVFEDSNSEAVKLVA